MKCMYLCAGVWVNFLVAVDCYVITANYLGGGGGVVGKLVASSCSIIAHLNYFYL